MPTTQAKAYGAEWVPYLDPPPKPAAVCLVDSGVNVTPDTPADSPDGPILERSALDGGSGEAGGSSWEELHGTRMAMAAIAPKNDWGTVGFAPGVRIVSVRAMPRGKTTFDFDHYRSAIAACAIRAKALNIKAVNLSLGCRCNPSATEQAALTNKIAEAHRRSGLSVVASAGNSRGAVGIPASSDGVFGIAAGAANGALCAFSNRGPGADLIAPGCDMELSDPFSGAQWTGYRGGTSAAAAVAASALALLRSYAPGLTREEAEEVLRRSARVTLNGPALDLAAAFRDLGLGGLVEAAAAKTPERSPTEPADGATTTVSGAVAPGFGLEIDAGTRRTTSAGSVRALARWLSGRLIVRAVSRNGHTRFRIWAQRRTTEFGFRTLRRAWIAGPLSAIKLRVRPDRLLLQARSTKAGAPPSWITVPIR